MWIEALGYSKKESMSDLNQIIISLPNNIPFCNNIASNQFVYRSTLAVGPIRATRDLERVIMGRTMVVKLGGTGHFFGTLIRFWAVNYLCK
jgi:hypothetical protein